MRILYFSHYVRMVICYNPHFGIHNAIGRLKRQSAKKLKEFDPTLKSRLPAIWTNQTKFHTIGIRCTEEEIKECFDYKPMLIHVDEIFARFGL